MGSLAAARGSRTFLATRGRDGPRSRLGYGSLSLCRGDKYRPVLPRYPGGERAAVVGNTLRGTPRAAALKDAAASTAAAMSATVIDDG